MALDFAPLAVSLPYVPGGDVQLVARIPGCAASCRWSKTCRQRLRHRQGGPGCRLVQLLAGEETLYLSSEDLVEGHVP